MYCNEKSNSPKIIHSDLRVNFSPSYAVLTLTTIDYYHQTIETGELIVNSKVIVTNSFIPLNDGND